MLFLTFLAFLSGSIFIMGMGYIGVRMCFNCCCHEREQPNYYTIPDNV